MVFLFSDPSIRPVRIISSVTEAETSIKQLPYFSFSCESNRKLPYNLCLNMSEPCQSVCCEQKWDTCSTVISRGAYHVSDM